MFSCKSVSIRLKSLASICPGADAFPAVPKVSAEPNVSPQIRLTSPVPAIDR